MNLSEMWENYGFEIAVGISIFLILILALFRIGKKGTWASYLYSPYQEKRKPPQESKGEIECRRVLEKYYGVPFPKSRPNIMRNSITDTNLELDCYNENLKIAVEYNGVQHYKFVPYFHKTRDAFQNQKYRDQIKRDLCVKNGIVLIEVPYTVKVDDIENFLIEKLRIN